VLKLIVVKEYISYLSSLQVKLSTCIYCADDVAYHKRRHPFLLAVHETQPYIYNNNSQQIAQSEYASQSALAQFRSSYWGLMNFQSAVKEKLRNTVDIVFNGKFSC